MCEYNKELNDKKIPETVFAKLIDSSGECDWCGKSDEEVTLLVGSNEAVALEGNEDLSATSNGRLFVLLCVTAGTKPT
jgi:hypothetical protein